MRCPRVGATLEDDHHRFAVHFAYRQLPGPRQPLVIAKVRRVHKVPRKPLGNAEPGVSTRQFTHSVPVVTVEAIDVQLHDLFQLGTRALSRLRRKGGFSQLGSSAVERCLDATRSGIDQFRNFFEGIVEYILQKKARALFGRQHQHKVLDSDSGI